MRSPHVQRGQKVNISRFRTTLAAVATTSRKSPIKSCIFWYPELVLLILILTITLLFLTKLSVTIPVERVRRLAAEYKILLASIDIDWTDINDSVEITLEFYLNYLISTDTQNCFLRMTTRSSF